MTEFFQHLEPLLRTFWFIALPVSLIFLIQTILTFIGMDSGDGTSADFDSNLDGGAPFQLFSFRNLINFLLGFSWAGISFYYTITSPTILVAFAVLAGTAMVGLFFFLMNQISRLAEDNTFRITETLGKSAQVYLSIPANRTGKGKIQISVKGAVHELEAVTDGDRLETGLMVRVEAVLDNNLVSVVKL